MKSIQIALIFIGFLLLELMVTNPPIEDHRVALLERMKEKMEESTNCDSKNDLQKAREAICMAIDKSLVDKAVSIENYLFFSITKFSIGDNVKEVGVGLWGHIWISDEKFDLINFGDKKVKSYKSKNHFF